MDLAQLEYNKIITIMHKEYETLTAYGSKKKALTVMNFDDAKYLFNTCDWLQFLICLNENNMTFGYCYNVVECEEFYKKEYKTVTKWSNNINDKIICEYCNDFYGININHQCFKCLNKII